MKTFADIQTQYNLKKYSDSPNGTLYFIPPGQKDGGIMVRHFDQEWSPELLPTFIDITKTAQEWIKNHYLDILVRIDQPREIGQDYYIRTHHYYYISTETYEKGDIEHPQELEILRDQLPLYLVNPQNVKEEILFKVLHDSIILPSGKTFWEPDEDRFIVVELKVEAKNLEKWSKV